jgi:release factor glutamine methyltransferase
LAYLTGEAGFFGRTFAVSPAVLVPRPETEVLVGLALEKLKEMANVADVGWAKTAGRAHADARCENAGRVSADHVRVGTLRFAHPTHRVPLRLLDLGTGSGAIAITLALETAAEVTACDLSAAALTIARQNAEKLGAQVRLLQGDLYAPVAGKTFDLIVSNPPYIAEDDPHLTGDGVRMEPRLALTCGQGGLDIPFRLIDGASAHLRPGGWLLLEHGHEQAGVLAQRLAEQGFAQVSSWHDLAGTERFSGGRVPW